MSFLIKFSSVTLEPQTVACWILSNYLVFCQQVGPGLPMSGFLFNYLKSRFLQAETLLLNIFSDLILMEAFKTMLWIFWFQGHYLSCKSMVVVHVSDMFAYKDHIVSNALKRES